MNILVTGGASGLGASIVKLLAGDNNNFVYFTWSTSSAAAGLLENTHANIKAIFCDFRDGTSVEALLGLLPGMDIDVLVNNAYCGIHKEHFHKIKPSVFRDSFDCNVMPVLRITSEAIKIFRKKKFGKIINIITSAVVNKPPIGWSEYLAGKSYLLAMSKAWATEYKRFNITSNSISPSFMHTKLTAGTDDRVIEQMIEDHPLNKLLSTDEVAHAVSFFTTSSQQVNGTNLIINAGENLA